MESLQKCKLLDQATSNRNFFDLQKEYCAHDTQTRIAGIDIRFCRKIEKFTEQFVFGQYTSPMRIIVLLSYPQSGVSALHIVIALKNLPLVCNVISVLVEMVNFAMVKVDNFCMNRLIAV